MTILRANGRLYMFCDAIGHINPPDCDPGIDHQVFDFADDAAAILAGWRIGSEPAALCPVCFTKLSDEILALSLADAFAYWATK